MAVSSYRKEMQHVCFNLMVQSVAGAHPAPHRDPPPGTIVAPLQQQRHPDVEKQQRMLHG